MLLHPLVMVRFQKLLSRDTWTIFRKQKCGSWSVRGMWTVSSRIILGRNLFDSVSKNVQAIQRGFKLSGTNARRVSFLNHYQLAWATSNHLPKRKQDQGFNHLSWDSFRISSLTDAIGDNVLEQNTNRQEQCRLYFFLKHENRKWHSFLTTLSSRGGLMEVLSGRGWTAKQAIFYNVMAIPKKFHFIKLYYYNCCVVIHVI